MQPTLREKLSRYEKKERELCTKLFESTKSIVNWEFTPAGSAARYDGHLVTSEQEAGIFEVKVRNNGIDRFPDHILELSKANALGAFYNKGIRKLLYINFFKNDRGTYDAIVFDIAARIPKWRLMGPEALVQKKFMNAATFKGNGKIEKEVIMLEYDPETDARITDGFGA